MTSLDTIRNTTSQLTHPPGDLSCGCYGDSGPYIRYCDQHDPETFVAKYVPLLTNIAEAAQALLNAIDEFNARHNLSAPARPDPDITNLRAALAELKNA